MAEIRPTYLMFVDIKNGVQSNKYYNMLPAGESFRVEYGRVGSTKQTTSYPMRKWNSTYNNKTGKGYEDITDLKQTDVVVSEDSGNSIFDEFYDVFSKYTGSMVGKTYMVDHVTQEQIDEAQRVLNKLAQASQLEDFNDLLLRLYKVIPRKMRDVRHHLINDLKQKDGILKNEQDALDGMDSSNIMHVANPFAELNIEFEEIDSHSEIEDLLESTWDSYRRAKIHKIYGVHQKNRRKPFNQFVKKQSNKTTKLLIHGTRNPNVFSILKSGLLVRPTNAASFAGSAYGDGIYHSAHAAKSLGYTGYDNDKVFLIQEMHLGDPYVYSGWYRDGKDISRSDMSWEGMQKHGKHSLFVKPGDGLLNSEYIVYQSDQTVTSYLVWLR